jgi:uncharacterized protein
MTLYFDPHIHMTSRTTDDYQAMAAAGIRAIVEPAFWLGQPRTSLGSFIDYYKSLLGWERFRASQFGIRHFCTIGLNSKEANNEALAEEVMAILAQFVVKEGVVGIGEIGYDEQSALEEKYFRAQLALARKLNVPVQIHTPHRDKIRGTMRSMDLCEDVGLDPALVLIDHNVEDTVGEVLKRGYWAGHTIYPRTKMDAPRMVEILKRHGTARIMVNSSADWGVSDPLSVPKTAQLMSDAGFSQEDVRQVLWLNPILFFSRSGQFTRESLEAQVGYDQASLFEGNSVLRGQTAQVK